MTEIVAYVLIAVVYGSTSLAVDVEMQSFETREDCNYAADILEKEARNIQAYCVRQ